MTKFKVSLILLLFLNLSAVGQETSDQAEELRINQFVSGTLLVPAGEGKPPLVIMIQGSGPTDRHGNQAFMKNDSFKKLARALAGQGIATFRYDKRIFEMERLGIQETEMRFDDFIADASSVIDFFSSDDRFEKTVVLGHSQGSLVGMLAAREKADAFISLAGVAQPIDSVIIEQIGRQMPGLRESAATSFKQMRETGNTSEYNPVLQSIFNPSVQPFLLSWMNYHPMEELEKLDMPVLIITGTRDLQVDIQEAEKLAEAQPSAAVLVVENLNHVLVEIGGDDLENSKSYNEPKRPLHPELVPAIAAFIRDLE